MVTNAQIAKQQHEAVAKSEQRRADYTTESGYVPPGTPAPSPNFSPDRCIHEHFNVRRRFNNAIKSNQPIVPEKCPFCSKLFSKLENITF